MRTVRRSTHRKSAACYNSVHVAVLHSSKRNCMDMHGPVLWTHPQSRSRLTTTLLMVAVELLCAVLAACGAPPAAQRQAVTGQTTQTRDRYTLTYVAVGASDAFGVGTEDPDRQSWPTQLAARLGDHVHLIN